jgi:hypothetical protein
MCSSDFASLPWNNIGIPRRGSPSVDPIAEFARALEGHHPPGCKWQDLTGCWIPSLPFGLVLYRAFSETADQDVVAGRQSGLHDLKQGLEDIGGLLLGVAILFGDNLNQVGFGELVAHAVRPFGGGWFYSENT